MKKIIVLLVVLAMVFAFAACQGQEQPAKSSAPAASSSAPAVSSSAPAAPSAPATSSAATAASGKKLKIGISINATSNIHNQTIFELTQKYAKDAGHEIIATNANGYAAQQATDIETLIEGKCDAIIVENGDKDGLRNVIKQASTAGIKIISYETGWVDGVDAMFSMNEFEVGAYMYQRLAAEMGFKGNVVTISHNDHPAVRSRRNISEGVLKEYTDIKEVAHVQSTYPGTVETCFKGLESLLPAHPEINAVWCTQDLEALGAMQACQAAGRSDIIMAGVDGEQDVFKNIKEGGQILFTIVGDQDQGSKRAIEACEKLVAGEKIPKFTSIPFTVVDKSNVDKFIK